MRKDGLVLHAHGEPAAPRARDPPLRATPPHGDSASAGPVRVDEAGHPVREPGRAHDPPDRGVAARGPRDVGDHGSRPVGRGERPRHPRHCLGELLAPNGRRAPGQGEIGEGGQAATLCRPGHLRTRLAHLRRILAAALRGRPILRTRHASHIRSRTTVSAPGAPWSLPRSRLSTLPAREGVINMPRRLGKLDQLHKPWIAIGTRAEG